MYLPQSRRWRFRAVLSSIVVVGAFLIYLGVHYSSPGNPENANGPEVPNHAEPKPAPFTAAKRRAVRPVLREFILDAVAGGNPDRAWDLSGPTLKQGFTRKEWRKGLPVVPYPAENRGLGTWTYVEYSYTNSVGLEVFLFPQPGSGYSAMTADVELVRGRDGRWLVDYWLPKRSNGPPALSAKAREQAAKAAKAAKAAQARGKGKGASASRSAEPAYQRQRTSRVWWAVPLGFIGLILTLPIVIPLVMWYRRRREERASLLGS